MAQNVGPILEMVTEKYLLRSEAEWHARQDAGRIFNEILAALRAGLRDQMARSPLCDGPRFARHLMELLRTVWGEWCRR